MRVTPALIVLLLAAFLTDCAVLTEGAFRFNTDESMVGVAGAARMGSPVMSTQSVPLPRVDDAPLVAVRLRQSQPSAVVPADVRPARSRLLRSPDDGAPDPH